MDREILFRAKHIHVLLENEHLDGSWVYGYLSDRNYINSPELEGELLVDKNTICRCTGIPDKNNKNIFEGDVVRRKIFDGFITGQVVWFDIGFCGFQLKCGNVYYHIGKDEHTGTAKDDEVIGNIFDNSELLEVET